MIWDLGLALLRRLDPETAHRLTIRTLSLGQSMGLGPNVSGDPDPILASTAEDSPTEDRGKTL